jgi:hypothetical protein
MLLESESVPYLVTPQGQRISLALGQATIGRNIDATINVTDDTVGRLHARIDTTTIGVTITDLGSTNGTWVNGDRMADGATFHLRDGDVVQVGGTVLHYVAPATLPPLPPPAVQFNTDQQTAGQINNVGHDQYLVQQRESFLREIAASRTRAKRLIGFGFVLFVVGGALFAWMVIRFIARVNELDAEDQPAASELLGQQVGGVPVGLIGWGIAGIGTVLMVTGIVLHIVATSRQRRTMTEMRWAP